jgi:hypothetical protein
LKVKGSLTVHLQIQSRVTLYRGALKTACDAAVLSAYNVQAADPKAISMLLAQNAYIFPTEATVGVLEFIPPLLMKEV